jgi:hypothetical protein
VHSVQQAREDSVVPCCVNPECDATKYAALLHQMVKFYHLNPRDFPALVAFEKLSLEMTFFKRKRESEREREEVAVREDE